MPGFTKAHVPMDFYRLKLSKSKLKAVTRTSALFSGFAMVAMVELGLDYSSLADETQADDVGIRRVTPSPIFLNGSRNTTEQMIEKFIVEKTSRHVIPQAILIIYALVTCLLVGVHMLALMISTCILPQIEAISPENVEAYFGQRVNESRVEISNTAPLQDDETELDNRYMSLNRRMLDNNRRSFDQAPTNDSFLNDTNVIFPYIQYHKFIELAWISSTVLGIFLFLVEIGLICFIKFYPISILAALSGAMVMTPILILFVVFTYTFYKRLAVIKVDLTKKVLQDLPNTNII